MWNETSYPKQVVKELCARMNERKGNGWTVKRFKIFSMDFVSPTLLPFFRRKFAGYTRFTSHPPFHTRNTRVYTPSGQVHPTSSPRENRHLDECWQSRIVLLGFKVSPRDRALITFPRTIHILLFGGKLRSIVPLMFQDMMEICEETCAMETCVLRLLMLLRKEEMFVWKHGVLKMLREDWSCIFELECWNGYANKFHDTHVCNSISMK